MPRFRVCWAGLVLCSLAAAGCGHHQFAGISRVEAQRQALGVARTWSTPLEATYFGPAQRKPVVVATARGRTADGRDAWLTVLRFRGDGSDKDAGCVWTWKAHGQWPFGFQEVPTVSFGRSGPAHDRCVARVTALGVLNQNDTVADDEVMPALAYPEPVSPYGTVPRGSFVADPTFTEDISLTGIPARFPNRTARGTVGYAGFVTNEGGRALSGASIWIWPAGLFDGPSDKVGPGRTPPFAVHDVSGRLGAFALLNFPPKRYGYDVLVVRPGYAPGYDVHLFDRGQTGLFLGDLTVGRKPSFYDDSTVAVAAGSGQR
jgi:hypothetical protein